jgi:hypothetical protein
VHLKEKLDTPMANLHRTVLDRMGVPVERFGDSDGRIELLLGI